MACWGRSFPLESVGRMEGLKKLATEGGWCDRVRFATKNAGIAQLVEQLICNQQVVGSSPTAGSLSQRDLHKYRGFRH